MENIKLAPPWIIYENKLNALFEKDKDVDIAFDITNKKIYIHVYDYEKCEALKQLLPKEKRFGSITFEIKTQYSKRENKGWTRAELFKKAFKDNPAFKEVREVKDVFSFNATYVVFEKEVVQYVNDSIGDLHGMESTLYQNIANEIFENHEGIFFCTDAEDRKKWIDTKKLNQPTKEEIELWEKYNGKGSYQDGLSPKSNKDKYTSSEFNTHLKEKNPGFNEHLKNEDLPF